MRFKFLKDFKPGWPGKLEYPLFGPDGADEFDGFVLRARYNLSWLHKDQTVQRPSAQYVRDQFTRDLQLKMGHVSANGNYFNLYINGIYWGMYNLAERYGDTQMEEYMGGDETEWTVINSHFPVGSSGLQSH